MFLWFSISLSKFSIILLAVFFVITKIIFITTITIIAGNGCILSACWWPSRLDAGLRLQLKRLFWIIFHCATLSSNTMGWWFVLNNHFNFLQVFFLSLRLFTFKRSRNLIDLTHWITNREAVHQTDRIASAVEKHIKDLHIYAAQKKVTTEIKWH